ncbi:MAG: hypothetical protein QN210_02160 [Armatimonadota bacterium]|nr:hypothetical protein [Armatimonadota bacterium]MDR7587216.1 hypothetical protein [Armatimonadota bacterium]MDR7611205.1 hypothetical protein [Armatimonadota bacterium]
MSVGRAIRARATATIRCSPTGETAGQLVPAVSQHGEEREDPVRVLLQVPRMDAGTERQILQDAHLRTERASLGTAAADDGGGFEPGELAPAEGDAAGCRWTSPEMARSVVDLPAPRPSEEGHHLSGQDPQREPLQRPHPPVVDGDLVHDANGV